MDNIECPACGHGVEWHGCVTGCDHVRDSLPTVISIGEFSIIKTGKSTLDYECGCLYFKLKVVS